MAKKQKSVWIEESQFNWIEKNSINFNKWVRKQIDKAMGVKKWK